MDSKIRIFDLIDGTEHRTSIANVAVGTHFYNMKIEGISLTLLVCRIIIRLSYSVNKLVSCISQEQKPYIVNKITGRRE